MGTIHAKLNTTLTAKAQNGQLVAGQRSAEAAAMHRTMQNHQTPSTTPARLGHLNDHHGTELPLLRTKLLSCNLIPTMDSWVSDVMRSPKTDGRWAVLHTMHPLVSQPPHSLQQRYLVQMLWTIIPCLRQRPPCSSNGLPPHEAVSNISNTKRHETAQPQPAQQPAEAHFSLENEPVCQI